ncbi:hypothetical protein SK128_020555 [Halocaridina rubra]|uniref:Glucose-methanol-choline oxidoreductase C-terminal domain-containing protein n=1 Tax=Halocaridina rubra TaxID=373956 RepID=A0AAN8X917_HALRR
MSDLPGVGKNLQDHAAVSGLSWTVNRGSSWTASILANPLNLKRFLRYGEGPMTSLVGTEWMTTYDKPFFSHSTPGLLTSPVGTEVMTTCTEGNAWAPSAVGDSKWPEIQLVFISATPAFDYGFAVRDKIGYDPEFYSKYFGDIYGAEGFSLAPFLSRPKSHGTVTLASNDPSVKPVIDLNFLDHPDDITALIRGIKFALAVGAMPAFSVDHGAKFHNKPLPGCEYKELGSDEYWECYIRHMATTSYHAAGSCKMAPKTDQHGVVDSRLRVYGISGLRVVDASIMPKIISTNLNAAVVMIAEKASDIIKEDWKAFSKKE